MVSQVSLLEWGKERFDTVSREKEMHTEKKAMGRQRERLDWYGHKPSNASSHQKLKEAENRFFAKAAGGSAALLTPWLFPPSETDGSLLASPNLREYMSYFKPLCLW